MSTARDTLASARTSPQTDPRTDGHTDAQTDAQTPPALLQVESLAKRYTLPRASIVGAAPELQALAGIDFTLHRGRSLGVVGESGSGKSTLARLVMALEAPTAGRVVFDGQDLHALGSAALRRARAGFQMVFQDPYGSLDPRRRVGQTVTEPLALLGGVPAAERRERAVEVLEAVGLGAADLDKVPHEFSGGQRQRIAIARALVTRPKLIVADEPVSALDVSVQAQVLNLMQDLQDRWGITYLFISHDLAVVDLVCDEVLVLQHGHAVEHGAAAEVLRAPRHPYTQRLLAALPGAGRPGSAPGAESAPPTPAAASSLRGDAR
ncbi:MAG: ABC transporter ATP-binding protein [Burkholderiales bacterium]|nr:ABC transporter ATP-binding protein [Burkholderiales bacterium]